MKRTVLSCLVLPLMVATIGLVNASPIQPAVQENTNTGWCQSSIGPPFDVVLEAAQPLTSLNGLTSIKGSVLSRGALNMVEVSFEGGPGLRLSAAPSAILDPMTDGQVESFDVPVVFEGGNRASATVHVRTASADGSINFERNESFFALEQNGRVYTGMGSFLQLEIQAIEDSYNRGELTEDAARAATKQLLQLPALTDQTPRPMINRSIDDQEKVDALVKMPEGLGRASSGTEINAGCITVQGHIDWQDENGVTHPAFGLNVQIWDEDTVFDEFVDVTATDTNGDYFITVNNDDGIGAGDRDIYAKVITANTAVSIEPAGIFTSPYEANSAVHDETPCGAVIVENFFFNNPDPNPAVNLCEGATWVAIYTKNNLNGGSFLGQIVLEWPGSPGSANYDGSDINLRPGDRWDWDVMFHEYGHYIQDTFNTEDNPGGPHNIGDCISNVHNSKSEGIRMAWGEGWPTYNGTVAQTIQNLASLNVPRVGDVSYTDTGESNFTYSLETSDGNGVGEDNELAIQRIFWDFYDAASDGLDNVSISDQTLFSVINGADPTTYHAAWAAIRGTLSASQLLGFGAVNTEHFVGPAPQSPAANAIVSPSNATFTWNRNVGCSSPYTGDGFTLRFFNQATSAPILSLPVGNTLSRALSVGELQTLIASSHNVVWAVEGSNSNSPATGPYLGANRAVIVNQPPVADAGLDRTVECTSYTTTPVQLNGTGSSDPDGDALTYTWTAPGVTWDNNHSATPTGQFPDGTTLVTLTVSDGLETDTDQVSVTVEDTTPPVITCPVDVTIECSGHCSGGGVLKTDPQLDVFFASVSAIDVCDPDPTITDDAPDCFALGTTTVTFTAKDEDNNASTCTADVTVQDTTPPVISVTLNRDALWPPNHKMATISGLVEVTDICDPNPTFVLTSITSDEPDDDQGDGNFPNDIQNAEYGTADTEFSLRSERMGGGDGRVYTIIYTASDESGNTSQDTVAVTVPHDQGASALASSGFTPTGTGIVPGSVTFQLVIPSRPGFSPAQLDSKWALVGNIYDATRPVKAEFRDVNSDHVVDLVLQYDVAATMEIRSNSTKRDPIGLHFSDVTGQSYLVGDIFALGAPMMMLDSDGDHADGTGIDDASGDPGQDKSGNDDTGTGLTGRNVDAGSPVTVEVFSVTGRRLRSVVTTSAALDRLDAVWDGKDETGRKMPTGMYFYRIRTESRVEVRKVMVNR